MAITAGAILDQARFALNDPSRTTWPVEEMLQYLSDGQRFAVMLRPEVNPVTVSHQLVAGSKQAIPDDGFVLLDVVRNMGADGMTPGGSITPTSRASLDQSTLDWHTAGASATVLNYIYDVRIRKTFYVYPAQPAVPHQVEMAYARTPPELSAVGDDIGIDDIYAPALVAYVLHRAFIKDVAVQGMNAEKSQMYFQWFVTMITGNADEKDEDVVRRHETTEALVGRRRLR